MFVIWSHLSRSSERVCNRLGIMVDGQLACLGTIQHLKSKFGRGYTIEIKLRSNKAELSTSSMERVIGFLQSLKQYQVQVKEMTLSTGVFQIQQCSPADLFELLEQNKQQLQIETYTISQTTLEQIFLSFGKKITLLSSNWTEWSMKEKQEQFFHADVHRNPIYQSIDRSIDRLHRYPFRKWYTWHAFIMIEKEFEWNIFKVIERLINMCMYNEYKFQQRTARWPWNTFRSIEEGRYVSWIDEMGGGLWHLFIVLNNSSDLSRRKSSIRISWSEQDEAENMSVKVCSHVLHIMSSSMNFHPVWSMSNAIVCSNCSD